MWVGVLFLTFPRTSLCGRVIGRVRHGNRRIVIVLSELLHCSPCRYSSGLGSVGGFVFISACGVCGRC